MSARTAPLVGLPADTYDKDGLAFHSVGDKYVRAVQDVAHAVPVVIPAIGDGQDIAALLDRLDGLVVTGATSNVHPPHYGSQPSEHHEPYDHRRDSLTLGLIDAAIARGVPLLCICRGFQELNVALGGSLDTEIHTLPGRLDHRAPPSPDLDVRYGPAHPIAIEPGGRLHAILRKSGTMVNTVHRQAIARLADRLAVEARAPDGTVEAVSVKGAPAFALAVQWHPESRAADNPDSVRLFSAFGDAARARAAERRLEPALP